MKWFRKKAISSPLSDKLTHLFRGSDGHDYYGFKIDSDLPLRRFEVQLMLLEHMRAGLTGEEVMNILQQIDTMTAHLLTSSEADRVIYAAKISTLTTICRARMSNTFHHDLLVAMAAVWIVRDDENPLEFSDKINSEKIKFFSAECEGDSAFAFFQRTGFAGLQSYMRLSEDEFKELWSNSQTQHRILADSIEKLILSSLRGKSSVSGKPS